MDRDLSHARPRPEAAAAIENLAVAAAWLCLFAPTLAWVARTLTNTSRRPGLLLFVAVLAWLLSTRRRRPARDLAIALATPPCLRPLPLSVTLIAAALYLAVERALDVDILAATLCGFCTYGLVGLYLSPRPWRRALPVALLGIAVLPFGDQADTYLGFAARLATATGASRILASLGAQVVPAQTILFLENGIAHVDVPCSGMRSLWLGALFFLGATVVERRRLDGSWLLIGVLYAALILVANTLRVTALIGLHLLFRLPRLAEILHAPIGLLGFGAASAIALLLLRMKSSAHAPQPCKCPNNLESGSKSSYAVLDLLLLACALHLPRPLPPAPPAPLSIAFPAGFEQEALPLTPSETDLFRRFGRGLPVKRRFQSSDGPGTLLIVYSHSFRAHHPPEICMAAAGIHVDRIDTIRDDATRAFRFAPLDGGRRTALYWYQSPSETTGDILARVFSELAGREKRWVQVSLILDQPPDRVAREGRDLFRLVRAAVEKALAAAGASAGASDEALHEAAT